MSELRESTIWILEREAISRGLYEEVLSSRFQVRFFQKRQKILNALKSEVQSPELLISSEWLDWAGDRLFVSPSAELEVLRDLSDKGISDFLIFPFNANELIVRVEKILNRSAKVGVHRKIDLRFDPLSRTVKFKGRSTVELTHRELQIFSAFWEIDRKFISRGDLITRVWGDVKVGGKALDVHLFNLRRKIVQVGLEIQFMPPDQFQLKAVV